MDPYLEEYLWPDVRSAIANKIRHCLAHKLRPRSVACLEVYVVEDSTPETEIGILYPDVEVMQLRQRELSTPSPTATDSSRAVAIPPAPMTLPSLQPRPVRLVNVEIRDTAQNQLVTCIIPIPLRQPDPDVSLNLAASLSELYDEAA